MVLDHKLNAFQNNNANILPVLLNSTPSLRTLPHYRPGCGAHRRRGGEAQHLAKKRGKGRFWKRWSQHGGPDGGGGGGGGAKGNSPPLREAPATGWNDQSWWSSQPWDWQWPSWEETQFAPKGGKRKGKDTGKNQSKGAIRVEVPVSVRDRPAPPQPLQRGGARGGPGAPVGRPRDRQRRQGYPDQVADGDPPCARNLPGHL